MTRVSSLWVGDSLSTMERLSIRSFQAQGHEFHLYTYGPVAGVPESTVLRDAAEILPPDKMFRYPGNGSYAGFANLFRYALLLAQGGWWVDLDLICLHPLPEPAECAFASQHGPQGGEEATNCAIFSHAGHALLQYLVDAAQAKDPDKLEWGETGPYLVQAAIRRFGAERFLLPADAFCPIPYFRWFDTFVPGRRTEFGPGTYAVHFWNEMWRRAQLDKDEEYGPRSLYEVLKCRFGVRSSEASATVNP
jgi:hypothetical protein